MWHKQVRIGKCFSWYLRTVKKDLIPVSITIQAANKIPVNILGAFKATFNIKSPNKGEIRCDSIVYVSNSVTEFFLLYETMVDYLIINNAHGCPCWQCWWTKWSRKKSTLLFLWSQKIMCQESFRIGCSVREMVRSKIWLYLFIQQFVHVMLVVMSEMLLSLNVCCCWW